MRRVAVAVLGGVLTLAGVALLVLPGPGFVLVAAGLTVLATQFAWAARPLEYAKGKARAGMDEVAESRVRAGFAAVAALVLLGLGVAELAGVRLPLMSALSAVLLIVSGLALLATLVYARRRGSRKTPVSTR